MGLLDTVADVGSGILDAAPVPGSDLVADGIDTAQDLLGGGGGGGSSDPQLPAPTTRRDSTGVSGSVQVPGLGSVNLQGSQTSTSPAPPQQGGDPGTQMMQGQGFGQAMMLEMLEDSIESSAGKAVLEAITSGSLQGGPIQQVQPVQTPKGTRNVSPPGFRTVYVNDQPYAVFKPLAKCMGLIDDSGRKTMREKMDDTTRKFLKYRREIERLSGKVGLKTENRKSGPKR